MSFADFRYPDLRRCNDEPDQACTRSDPSKIDRHPRKSERAGSCIYLVIVE